MDKLILKKYDHFKFIEKIYYKNENGKGYRSIGEWIIVRKASTVDPSNYDFNEHQVKHLEKVIETYDCAIIMKEAYAEKYRIHDPYSFGAWFLANIYGGLVYEDFNQLDEKIISIHNLIKECLYKINLDLHRVHLLSASEGGQKILNEEIKSLEYPGIITEEGITKETTEKMKDGKVIVEEKIYGDTKDDHEYFNR